MICLLQRVTQGEVVIDETSCGKIGPGLVILVGFQPHDTTETLTKMCHKLLHYRVFADAEDKMNLNLQQTIEGKGADLLLVPQFTLAANTQKGLRPSFSSSAAPHLAEPLFNEFIALVEAAYRPVQKGQFGANMQVSLTNDGPVTFWLEN